MSDTHATMLPEGWAIGWSSDYGVPYYTNSTLGITQWDPPPMPAALAGAASVEPPSPAASFVSQPASPRGDATLPEGWVARIDPTYNMTYYFDLVNQISQWVMPTAPAAPADSTVSPLSLIHI